MRRALKLVAVVVAAAAFGLPVQARAAGGAPGEPVVYSPADGSEFGEQREQEFVVSATDPEGDPYRAVVTVVDATTGAAVSFGSATVRSGTAVAVRPPVELPPGSYTWTAAAVDEAGNPGPASAARRLSVSRRPASVYPSDQCRAGTVAPVDGVVGPTFVRVRHVTPVPGETWVCVRTDAFGARLVVKAPALSASPPVVAADAEAAACATAPGNAAPGPHPVLSDGAGSSLDVYQGPGGLWVCVQAGPVAARLVLATTRLAAGGAVAVLEDGPGWRRPAPVPNTAPVSGECQRRGGAVTVVNADVPGGHAWLEALPQPGNTRVCARLGSRGGVLSVGGNGSAVGTDGEACGMALLTLSSPGQLAVRWSEGVGAPPRPPVSICFSGMGVGPLSVTVVPDGSAPPPVAWTPDA